MAEDLIIGRGNKQENYECLLPQVASLMAEKERWVANLGNFCAALKEQFGWLWVGFYLVETENTLVLGPFQGPVACLTIQKGKGVCGHCWAVEKTVVVPNVALFTGHIACSSRSKSEIVVPVFKNNRLVAVLDVDSEELDHFDDTDTHYLEKLVQVIPWP